MVSAFAAVFLLCLANPLDAQVINEWVANHTGSPDSHEFVEVFGTPNTDYSYLSVIHVEGDSSTTTGTIGRIDRVYQVGTTDADGYWFTGFLSDEIENGSMTLLLVSGFTGAVGDDIDSNNDGTMDTTFWTAIVDDIAASDGGGTDATYASTELYPNFDGITYTPGGASRIPNGTDNDAVSDWMRNDYEGCGLPGFEGNLDDEACNTPGEENSTSYPPPTGPLINEFVADHVGAPDDHEYIEIVGDARNSYYLSCLAVIIGDQGSTGVVDFATQIGFTSGSGYWSTGFLNSELEDGSFTIIVAEWSSCSSAVGSDLDSNDDGVFDSPPWSTLYDSLSVDDGDAGDIAYSSTVLDAGFDGVGMAVGGASRMPDGADGAEGSWMRNDFDGAGLEGFAGSLASGEAFNTPVWRNRVGLEDYYAGVNDGSPESLRESVHEIIDDHRRFNYTDQATDVWDILEDAQEDPNDSNRILDVYKNASYPKYGGGNSDYDREHTWPKSFGFTNDSPANYPYTDCHQLMLADGDYNVDRSNHPFRSCNPAVNPSCSELGTELNNGAGGNPGSGYPGNSNWDAGSFDQGSWETWIGKRGDVARAQLYMDVRYEGGHHNVTYFIEPDLILTDDNDLISDSVTGYNETVAYMGILSDLLLWHEQDPVDDDERYRNEVVYSYQGNRNPFVDHPEWVDCIFHGTGCGGLFVDGFESGDSSEWSVVVP